MALSGLKLGERVSVLAGLITTKGLDGVFVSEVLPRSIYVCRYAEEGGKITTNRWLAYVGHLILPSIRMNGVFLIDNSPVHRVSAWGHLTLELKVRLLEDIAAELKKTGHLRNRPSTPNKKYLNELIKAYPKIVEALKQPVVDLLVRSKGGNVVWTPPHEHIFQPIEMFWAVVKFQLRKEHIVGIRSVKEYVIDLKQKLKDVGANKALITKLTNHAYVKVVEEQAELIRVREQARAKKAADVNSHMMTLRTVDANNRHSFKLTPPTILSHSDGTKSLQIDEDHPATKRARTGVYDQISSTLNIPKHEIQKVYKSRIVPKETIQKTKPCWNKELLEELLRVETWTAPINETSSNEDASLHYMRNVKSIAGSRLRLLIGRHTIEEPFCLIPPKSNARASDPHTDWVIDEVFPDSAPASI